ncbi:MAG: hypothetical protein ACHQ4H_08750 [Ktedonobacterales bacterium]
MRLSSLLLMVGAAVGLLALYLPWQQVTAFNSALPGGHDTADLSVTSALVPNPNHALTALYFVNYSHTPLITAFAQILWSAVPSLMGIALLLVFFTWRAPVVRWISGAAYALWLTLCTAIAINFPITLNYVSHASYATLPPHPQPPNVFQRLIAIGNIYGATSTRPTWGYALFWLALAASWCGLVVAAVMHMRLRSPGAAPSVPERRVARGRGVLLAALLCTLGVAIWGTAMLAVPVARVDCLHPFRAVSPSTQAQCQQNSQLYPIETLALAPLLTTAPDPANRLASEETVYLFALRTFVLLTLTLLAAPFALLAVWRHGRGSGAAVFSGQLGGICWCWQPRSPRCGAPLS